MTEKKLVYGEQGGQLIFAEKSLVDDLVLLLSGFETWGAAREGLTHSRWEEIVERMANWEIQLPADNQAFSLDDIPGYADGDWPEWPAQLMIETIPSSVQSDFGSTTDSVLNGEFLQLGAGDEVQIVKDLEVAGYTCTRDDKLIAIASGY